MLIASNLMLNVGLDQRTLKVYPYLMSLGGRKTKDAHLRGIEVNDRQQEAEWNSIHNNKNENL